MGLLCLLAATLLEARGRSRPPARPGAPLNRTLIVSRRRVLNARPLAMYYYHDDARGLESLRAHAREMTLLGPQCFWVEADGIVHGVVPPEIAEIAKQTRLPLMPLVVNRGFDRRTASAMLRNDRARERAATYIAYLAKRENYVGFQIDLENIDPADKKLFSRFVQQTAARLHRDGRLLSIAVVPRFSDTFPGQSHSGEFKTGEWGAPFDYRALGQVVDFMAVMTYDHHGRLGSPGPIAGLAWVEEALEYAAQRVPRQKLLLGIPFYGRDWLENEHGTIARSLTFKEATALRDQVAAQPQWDDRWRSPWFEFRDGPALHKVWFEDSRSLAEKLRLMRKNRLRGYAAWRLGAEDPQFWTLAKSPRQRGTSHAGDRAPRPPQRMTPRRAAASP